MMQLSLWTKEELIKFCKWSGRHYGYQSVVMLPDCHCSTCLWSLLLLFYFKAVLQCEPTSLTYTLRICFSPVTTLCRLQCIVAEVCRICQMSSSLLSLAGCFSLLVTLCFHSIHFYVEDDHLSGIPGKRGNVREFNSCQRHVTGVSGKILSGETVYCSLHVWGYTSV